ncbi:MAG TPA: hypothetical protein PKL73_06280 [Polyangiaceae bacterium]|jgi:hypothetical protein|nr:MAG: hypothetical protein BWY17_01639 [Deltaproteobacteria bacterium ADurb.Bin207]HNS96539.1 hypothetical protein [Polyangiaceae bacterium]HNZ21534.1 hypothetical protein [Polyangiaceae bacterium]HOD21674.1 hypothetical protein [Polyangiaceae bacterium]HOE48167.1 hypothetical protein [Polyangiaceae bacterium]
MARLSALRSSDPREDALDSIEVPAAVVCARCGKPDCPGCDSLDETTLPSGVISIVPWERPGTSAWSRLWLTARAATRSAASFFQSLPPGSHTSAFSFSLIAEFYAVVSWAVFISLLVALPLHDIAWLMLKNPAGRAMLARLWVVGTVGFTVVLVVGHAIYGVALDKGARRTGARSRFSQALRFGLYASGWDLLTSPLGLLVSLIAEGPRATIHLLTASMGLPRRAATAFLRGIYHLEGPPLAQARNYGTTVAIILSITGAIVVLVSLVFAALGF